MAGPVLAAAISAGSNLLNGVFQGISNRKNRKAQERENDKQRQFALDMWNRNNEYNLPINQMSRLRQAGINPHLAYSNGSPMNTSNAPAQASGSPLPAGESPRINIGELAQLMLMKAQKENIEADTEKKKAEADNVGVNTESAKIELGYKERQLASQVNLTEQQIEESKARVNKIGSEIESLAVGRDMTRQQIQNLKANLVLVSAQVGKLLEETKTEKFRRSNIEADTLYKNELIKSLQIKNRYADEMEKAILEKLKEDTKHLQFMQEMMTIDKFKSVTGWIFDSMRKQMKFNPDFIPVSP